MRSAQPMQQAEWFALVDEFAARLKEDEVMHDILKEPIERDCSNMVGYYFFPYLFDSEETANAALEQEEAAERDGYCR